MKALRIKAWDRHYENNRSRDLKRPEWLPLPNKFDGTGFMELMDHPAGMSHYGAWCLLLAAASKMPTRGLLVTDSGKAMTIKDIARMARASASGFEEALPRLLAIGWVEEVEIEDDATASDSEANAKPPAAPEDADHMGPAEKSQHGAGSPQQGAGLVPLNGKGNGKGNIKKNDAAAASSPREAATASRPEDFPPDDPTGRPIEIVPPMSKTVGDLISMHGRIYVPPVDRESWAALLAEYGWEPLDDACRTLDAETPPGKRILLSRVSLWLSENYRRKGSA